MNMFGDSLCLFCKVGRLFSGIFHHAGILFIARTDFCRKFTGDIPVKNSLYFGIEFIYEFLRYLCNVGFFFGLNGSDPFSVKETDFSEYLGSCDFREFDIPLIDSEFPLEEEIEKIAFSGILFYEDHSFGYFTDFLETFSYYFFC